MKIAKPSASVMYEYLMFYGIDWVQDFYKISFEEICNLIYGGIVPTPEKQKKKAREVLKIDSKRNSFILSSYERDHFIWDKPNSKHLRCQNALDEYSLYWSDKFLSDWTKRYKNILESDMKFNKNGMKSYGWSLGERIINKTTSKTTDDIIQDRFLNMLLDCKVYSKSSINYLINRDHFNKISGHGYENENFLENLENLNLDNIKSINQDISNKNNQDLIY